MFLNLVVLIHSLKVTFFDYLNYFIFNIKKINSLIDSKKSDENIMNFYDRALIKARDEVIQRQQQSEKQSEYSSNFKNSYIESEDYSQQSLPNSSKNIKELKPRRWNSFKHSSKISHFSFTSLKRSENQISKKNNS